MRKDTEWLVLNIDYWGFVILGYMFFFPAFAWKVVGQRYISIVFLISSIICFCFSIHVANKSNKLKRLIENE